MSAAADALRPVAPAPYPAPAARASDPGTGPAPVTHAVTVIPGDGIGPEVVAAARRVVDATGVRVQWEEAEAGGAVFARGLASGVPAETVASVERTGVVLKGPLATPLGGGGKSANVTLRKLFETYGNVRPVRELPGVVTPFSGRGVDLVIVRENVEDLYAGIEHMQTPGVAQSLKLITRKGCEKIVRLAFELARAEGRPSVHCVTKSNILKLTEGMLQRTFEAVAPEYPEVRAHHMLVDNCAMQLVMRPEQFSVIVTTNMNGDILSDLASGLVGGLGFAPSANLGSDVAMFEAVHGTAPDIAGQDKANPTALVLSAAQMLRHLGEARAADDVEHALLLAMREGARTADLPGAGPALGTAAFADAVIARLGRRLDGWAARPATALRMPAVSAAPDFVVPATRRAVGADVFVESALDAESLGRALERLVEGTSMRLLMVSNRGTQLYPAAGARTDAVDHWRCRFVLRDADDMLDNERLLGLLSKVGRHFVWMHVEKLNEFDGAAGFTKAQGQA